MVARFQTREKDPANSIGIPWNCCCFLSLLLCNNFLTSCFALKQNKLTKSSLLREPLRLLNQSLHLLTATRNNTVYNTYILFSRSLSLSLSSQTPPAGGCCYCQLSSFCWSLSWFATDRWEKVRDHCLLRIMRACLCLPSPTTAMKEDVTSFHRNAVLSSQQLEENSLLVPPNREE